MGSCIGSPGAIAFEHHNLWQDRLLRWDQAKSCVAPRSGEVFTKQYENIEDTKGENGLGSLTISNLRVIWVSNHNPKLNISIGLGNISYIHFNMADSPTFGRVRAPHLMTQLGHSKFEFTFASRSEAARPLFSDLDAALRRYKATRVFRDLVFRDGQLMKDKDVVVYHGETLLKKFRSCENLTSDESFPGSMFITDRRMIWNSSQLNNVNVSVPYIQFRSIGSRSSPFGTALVVETTQAMGVSYVLGFKFENSTSLHAAFLLLSRQFHLRKIRPFFGPLDGVVQYVDDHLVVVPGSAITDGSDSNEIATQSTLAPDDSQLECKIHSRDRSLYSSDASSLEIREPRRDVMQPLREPVNLSKVDPLLIRLDTGQASVVYSAKQGEQAEFLLSISPSSKKYQAPQCVVCMATPTEVAFDPCGHLCSCMTCAAKLKFCPICRTDVEKLLRIYLHAA